MTNELDNIKKKILYRASYRGTKELDLLLSSFVKKYINLLDNETLIDLEKFLNLEDEVILNFYQHNISHKDINKNKISKIFRNFKM